MDSMLKQALSGQLENPQPSGSPTYVTVDNQTGIPLYAYTPRSTGDQMVGKIGPKRKGDVGKSTDPKNFPDALYVGDYVILSFPGSGGAVTVLKVESAKQALSVRSGDLTRPNNIGGPPKVATDRPIPPDSPLVVVGTGGLQNGNFIVREQFWRRTGDSYTVAPGETMTVSYSRTIGVESVSSTTTEIATALGISVGGGLGPLMVSANASLNLSTSSFQQLTTSEETTTYESLQVDAGDKKATWFRWQLTDVVSIYSPSPSYLPLATIVASQDPVVVTGPHYDIDALSDDA